MTKLNIISQEDRDEWLAATSAMAGNKFGEVYVNKDGNLLKDKKYFPSTL